MQFVTLSFKKTKRNNYLSNNLKASQGSKTDYGSRQQTIISLSIALSQQLKHNKESLIALERMTIIWMDQGGRQGKNHMQLGENWNWKVKLGLHRFLISLLFFILFSHHTYQKALFWILFFFFKKGFKQSWCTFECACYLPEVHQGLHQGSCPKLFQGKAHWTIVCASLGLAPLGACLSAFQTTIGQAYYLMSLIKTNKSFPFSPHRQNESFCQKCDIAVLKVTDQHPNLG